MSDVQQNISTEKLEETFSSSERAGRRNAIVEAIESSVVNKVSLTKEISSLEIAGKNENEKKREEKEEVSQMS